jgi:hypothetical protein
MQDLIDFPCSDDWLDFYHERGLTPRSSGRPSARPPEPDDDDHPEEPDHGDPDDDSD